MKLCIPTNGDRLVLTKAWTFGLHHERRNYDFHKKLGHYPDMLDEDEYGFARRWCGRNELPHIVTLPKGTILTVDRVYIRKGIGEYDSITFRIKDGKGPHKSARFWAKLEDVNTIYCEIERKKSEPEAD